MAVSKLVDDDITVESLSDDPYPIYARLRREAPVCFVPAVGLWFVTRWADVEYGTWHLELFPASVVGSPLDRTLGGTNVLTVDGEAHHERREPLDRALRPKVAEQRAPEIVRTIADELLDAIAPRGHADLIAEYFEPLSTRSLALVIGLGDLGAFTSFGGSMSSRSGRRTTNGIRRSSARPIRSAWRSTARSPLFARRLEEPDDTMASYLIHVPGDLDERLRWVMPTLKLVLIGGLQELGHGMGSTVYGLLGDPEQGRALAADPEGLVGKAVDEGLRWISPIGTQARASEGAEVGGVRIPPGDNVAFLVPSANRDDAVWGPTADRFDMFRPRHPHAGFGFGSHFCVGHYLARIQMRLDSVAVRAAAAAAPDPDIPARLRGWEYRSPSSACAVGSRSVLAQ